MKTVESVTEGHPDKICDQVSDAILDAYLEKDPHSRVAVETFGSHGVLVIGGEVTSKTEIKPEVIAEELYKKIGYEDKLELFVNIEKQSPDIAMGVDTGGAGDQGIMYGYATDETSEFLPQEIVMAHGLTRCLADLRKHHPDFFWLGPDGKSQITIEKGRVKTVLVSTQHNETIASEIIKEMLTRHLVRPIIGDIEGIEVLINPTGRFVKGGFVADTGLTGRKIMVDTYGGLLPHGGGAFSGKDPSKVDRSAAYMARFAAKNIVAHEHAKNCLVSVAYAIGRAEPLMISARSSDGRDLSLLVKQKFDFRPQAIIERLNLLRPIYLQTAAYGHFGKPDLPWEKIVEL
ncbi:MAG: methionine adenosyltransferase [Patescibacteria group bacterium]|nr:methionine adenosyltransferase [Patescibacteria group bacterium]